MKKSKIIKIQKKIVPTLKKHGVVKASIFGSYARGEETEKSDVDLMIKFAGRKSLLDLVGLKLDLEDKTGIKFDITTYKAIHHLIKDRVFREHIVILN